MAIKYDINIFCLKTICDKWNALKLELVDKWHNWLRHMICDVINNITEVSQHSRIGVYIYFPVFIPVCFFKGA